MDDPGDGRGRCVASMSRGLAIAPTRFGAPALDIRHARMHGFFARTTGATLASAFKGRFMADSVYKVIELVGTSSESWEKATAAAVELASKSLRDLRVAEVKELDVAIEDGRVAMYRAKLSVSFKYEGGD